MKKRTHWWLVVDRETGLLLYFDDAYRTRHEAYEAMNAYEYKALYKVIKVVPA